MRLYATFWHPKYFYIWTRLAEQRSQLLHRYQLLCARSNVFFVYYLIRASIELLFSVIQVLSKYLTECGLWILDAIQLDVVPFDPTEVTQSQHADFAWLLEFKDRCDKIGEFAWHFLQFILVNFRSEEREPISSKAADISSLTLSSFGKLLHAPLGSLKIWNNESELQT